MKVIFYLKEVVVPKEVVARLIIGNVSIHTHHS